MMKRFKIAWPAVVLVIMTMCTGWFWGGKAVSVRFDQVHGLKTGDRVTSEGMVIGKVTDVDYQDSGRFLVALRIEDKFGDRVTEYSRFSIISDPDNGSRMAVDLVLERTGGAVLPGGAVVEGVTRSQALLGKLLGTVNESFSQMSRHLDEAIKELKALPESDQVKELGRELDRLGDEAARAGEKTRKHIQEDILPKLKQEVDRLKKELEKKGRQEETRCPGSGKRRSGI